ncbi:small nucleolar protein, partial [Tubulinosema ratisbonensis]
MSFQQRKKFTRNFNDETGNKVPLGKLIHTCSTDLVLVLTNQNIPFPNAPVYWKDTKIGMVDEVFGQLNNVYLSVKLDKVFDIKKYKKREDFFGLENKFIKKERFLSRTDEQKVKEKKDKKEVKDKGKRDYSRNNDRKREFGKRNYDENKRNDRKESRFIENKDGKKERNDFGKKERFDRK